MKYEVIKEDGVEVDGAEFACGEQIDIDPEVIDVSELLADGSIAIVDEEEEEVPAVDDTVEDDAVEEAPVVADEPTDDDIIAEVEESGLSYEGKKLVGEVTDEEVEGLVYKCFSVESGEHYKLPADEFEAEVK
jgi:hypothetical protein